MNEKYYIESVDDFQFELDLIEHLFKADIPVAPAKPRDNKELLGLTTTLLGERAFALFTYAAGDTITRHSVTKERCFNVGKSMAEFHLASNSFKSEHNRYHLDRKYLVDEPLRIIARQNDEKSRIVSKRRAKEFEKMISEMQPVEDLMDTINSLDVSGDEYGVIHGDLHPGNIHFVGDQPTFFDFDHCAYGWRAYELAITEFMKDSQSEAILSGYESVRPLSRGERDCIPAFAKLRQLWDVGDSLAIDPIRAESSD